MRVLVLALAFAVLPAVPAAAETCPEPGGAQMPTPETAAGDFSIGGHGWGHGVGMSQYGAYGAATLGCSSTEILAAYYPGAELGTGTPAGDIRVMLPRPTEGFTVTAVDGDLTWELPDGTEEVQDQGTDRAVDLRDPDDPDENPEPYRITLDGTTARLSGFAYPEYRRGVLEIYPRLTTVIVVDLEEYLYGLAEVPASWPEAVLRAQVVAARTYALRFLETIGDGWETAGCRCHILSTPAHQVYAGVHHEVPSWMDAVHATSGQVLRFEGALAQTFYSSSHGGHSLGNEFAWRSTQIPYLEPIDDSRWELAVNNRYRVWSVGVSAERLGEVAGVGTALSIEEVDDSGPGGRIVEVRIRGTEGEATVSGRQLYSSQNGLGLRAIPVTITGGADPEDVPEGAAEACPDGAVSDGGFDDIEGNTHEAAIDCIVWWALTQGVGDGRYEPTWPVTRDQMASFIARLVEAAGHDLPEPSDQGFDDIEGNTHAERINQLAEAGIVHGTTSTTYAPRAEVRRDQMASFLVRAWETVTEEALTAAEEHFDDTADSVHAENIDKAAEAGFARGVGERMYAPARSVRRDQMASFLARVLDGFVATGHAEPRG